MVQIELKKEELETIINLMMNSSVQMAHAEKALLLLKKFKEAKE